MFWCEMLIIVDILDMPTDLKQFPIFLVACNSWCYVFVTHVWNWMSFQTYYIRRIFWSTAWKPWWSSSFLLAGICPICKYQGPWMLEVWVLMTDAWEMWSESWNPLVVDETWIYINLFAGATLSIYSLPKEK